MPRNYWLDLFTGKTWEEFLNAGGATSGFRTRMIKAARKVHPGDYFLCYLTGLSRFIGIIEVLSDSFVDYNTTIWEDESFPVRFKVKLARKLEPETAVPIKYLKDRLSVFRNLKSPNAWTGSFRRSLFPISEEDGDIIVAAIGDAAKNPVRRPYDEKKFWRRPKTFDSNLGKVTVPTPEKRSPEPRPGKDDGITHEEIQYTLLKLGSEMGLDVWVAKNDQNKSFEGRPFKDIPNLRVRLPRQFDEATNRTIEFIDVLWLSRDAIVAAFEVEHTKNIMQRIRAEAFGNVYLL